LGNEKFKTEHSMPNNSRKYLVKMADGQTSEPCSQDDLMSLAEAGELLPDSQVRSDLVPLWGPASGLIFLKPIFKEQALQAESNQGNVEKMRRRLTRKANVLKSYTHSLLQSTFHFSPAPASLRLLAGFSDLMLILLYALIIAGGATGAVQMDCDATMAFQVGSAILYLGILLYFTLTLGFKAQTCGQWFWGLMIVRADGDPVYLGRAFIAALGTMLFGLLTPITAFVLPAKRALPELISGTRLVRIKVTSS
jgi:uncharacterized RDD family membrane protein YckC